MQQIKVHISNPPRPYSGMNEHGLCCEFRRAVNAGHLVPAQFDAFVAHVVAIGGLKNLAYPVVLS